jgi:hypothetical protein
VAKGVLKDPDDPSRTYEAFAFETMRVKDGKSPSTGHTGSGLAEGCRRALIETTNTDR